MKMLTRYIVQRNMEYHISKEKPYVEVKVKHEHFYILALTSHLLKGNQVTNFLKNCINHTVVRFGIFKKTNVTQLLESLLNTFQKYKIESSLLSVMDHLSNEDHH